MKKLTSFLLSSLVFISIIFYLNFLPLYSQDLEAISKYNQNPQKINEDYPNISSMKGFIEKFSQLIYRLENENNIDGLLECKRFWDNYFQDNAVFTKDENMGQMKRILSAFFKDFENRLTKDIDDRIKKLEFIGGDESIQFKLVAPGKINNYLTLYRQIYDNLIPKEIEQVNDLETAYKEILKNYNLDTKIVEILKNYINLWKSYYKIKIPDNNDSDGNENTSSKIIEKLTDIKNIAESFSIIGMKPNINDIDSIIQTVEKNENRLRIQKEIITLMSNFEQSKNPDFEELIKIIAKINSEGNTYINWWDKNLHKKVRPFLCLTGSTGFSIENLEQIVQQLYYLSKNKKPLPGKNYTKTVIKKFKNCLIDELNNSMNKGVNSLNDVEAIKSLLNKYKKYFKEPIQSEKCLKLLENYHIAKERNDYYSLIDLYIETNKKINETCGRIFSNWQLMNPKEFEDKHIDFFVNQLNQTLGDSGDKLNKINFTNFFAIYNKLSNIYEIESWEIWREWKKRFENVNKYFNPNNPIEKNDAISVLNTQFPKLAQRYSIPSPTLPISQNNVTQNDMEKDSTQGTITHPKAPDQAKTQTSATTSSTRLPDVITYVNPTITKDSPETANLDYIKLLEMYEEVPSREWENEISKYIIQKSPFNSHGQEKSSLILQNMAKLHDYWKILPDKDKEFFALLMIGRMCEYSENAKEAKEVYSQALTRMQEEKRESIDDPANPGMSKRTKEEIEDSKINYENLPALEELFFKANGANPLNINSEQLQNIIMNLTFKLLPPRQRVKAYYMLANLYLKLKTPDVIHGCFYFGKAYTEMVKCNLDKIQIKDSIIDKENLKDSACQSCKMINPEDINGFKDNQPVQDFLNECQGKK